MLKINQELKLNETKTKIITQSITALLYFFFAGCEKESDFSEPTDSMTGKEKAIVKKFSVRDATNSRLDLNLNATLMASINSVKAKILLSNTLLSNSLYKFSFDENNGYYIKKDNNQSYTFPIYRNYVENKVENLVFKKNILGGFDPIIVTYNMTNELMKNATIEAYKNKISYIDLNTGKISIPCYVWMVLCDNTDAGEDPGHQAHQACLDAGGTYGAYVYQDDCGGGGNGGDGGNGGENGTGGVIITTPVGNAPHGGGAGGTTTPCRELQKTSNSAANKAALATLESRTMNNSETGFAVRYAPNNPDVVQPPEVMTPDPNDPHSLNVTPYLNGNYVALEHHHTNPLTKRGIQMFSPHDIECLYKLAKNYNSAANGALENSAFTVTVAVRNVATNTNTTFAIKINDFAALEAVMGNPGCKEDFFKVLTRNLKYSGNRASLNTLETDLFKTFKQFNLGVSLYQATNSTLTNWNELVMDEETLRIRPIPCR